MKMKTCLRALCVLGAFTHGSAALAVIDANAPVVKLRDPANGGCTEAGVALHNCFTSLPTLNTWVSNTRKPTAVKPLFVDIGPGKFVGTFGCSVSNYAGYVTLQGAGMKNTVIENGSSPVSTTRCVQMRFSDMTLRNTGNLFGVQNLGGSTFWDNVEIDGLGYAWFDTPGGCPTTPRGSHYWFNSKITSRSAANSTTSYYNACDESWFFGSEITATGTATGAQITPIRAAGGEVHVYGSVIRAISGAGIASSGMVAVTSFDSAEVHIHGTGIDVLSTEANNITALSSSNGGKIHADGAAYNLKTGSGGSITRVNGEGHDVHAPYLWSGHATPPNITSQDGADTAVVTSETGGTPRLVIYSTACSSKWFDVGSNACRP
ncbi:MAG: hypothetical protein ABL877_01385 [Thiobacillus sp.]